MFKRVVSAAPTEELHTSEDAGLQGSGGERGRERERREGTASEKTTQTHTAPHISRSSRPEPLTRRATNQRLSPPQRRRGESLETLVWNVIGRAPRGNRLRRGEAGARRNGRSRMLLWSHRVEGPPLRPPVLTTETRVRFLRCPRPFAACLPISLSLSLSLSLPYLPVLLALSITRVKPLQQNAAANVPFSKALRLHGTRAPSGLGWVL